MIQNQNQYEAVKEILIKNVSKRRRDRTKFKTRELYKTISENSMDKYYIDLSYEEFYEIFKAEVLCRNFPDRKFHIMQEYFLDYSETMPEREIFMECIPKNKKAS